MAPCEGDCSNVRGPINLRPELLSPLCSASEYTDDLLIAPRRLGRLMHYSLLKIYMYLHILLPSGTKSEEVSSQRAKQSPLSALKTPEGSSVSFHDPSLAPLGQASVYTDDLLLEPRRLRRSINARNYFYYINANSNY